MSICLFVFGLPSSYPNRQILITILKVGQFIPFCGHVFGTLFRKFMLVCNELELSYTPEVDSCVYASFSSHFFLHQMFVRGVVIHTSPTEWFLLGWVSISPTQGTLIAFFVILIFFHVIVFFAKIITSHHFLMITKCFNNDRQLLFCLC